MQSVRAFVYASLFLLALMCSPADAATIRTVTNLNDSGVGSLRDAIAASAAGDTIVFAPGLTGSILLVTTLPITQSITIRGPGLAIITLSGQATVRVLDITAGGLILSGATIANGNVAGLGGGVRVGFGTTFTVRQCAFTGNNANNGGAIAGLSTSVLSVDECTFAANTTTGIGGGAIITFGTATVTNSTFASNTAPINGGAINVQSAGTLTLINSTLFGNVASGQGGALSNLGTMTVINSTIAGNQGSSGAGLATGNANVTLYNNVFADNSPGALFPLAFPGTASNNVFFNNGVPEDQTGYGTSNFGVATAEPLLPLANYGGPTQTMAPVPGGAAICAGSVALLPAGLIRDQRGFPRTSAGCVDAGADQSATAVPALSNALLAVLVGLLALFGFRRLRHVTG